MLDPTDSASVASTLSLAQLDELEQADALRGGMAVKAAAIRLALERGVPRVHVVSGLETGALLGELYTTQGAGTLLTREPQTAPVADALGAFA